MHVDLSLGCYEDAQVVMERRLNLTVHRSVPDFGYVVLFILLFCRRDRLVAGPRGYLAHLVHVAQDPSDL